MDQQIDTPVLQQIAEEMRQFESIFLWPTSDPRVYRTRIFTMEEELGFAGHPLLGAASALHASEFSLKDSVQLKFDLSERSITVHSTRSGPSFHAEMNQGCAIFSVIVGNEHQAEILHALNLSAADLIDELPLQVVSTGLPYLIVPTKSGLEQARITISDFEGLLGQFGAKFAYVLDVLSFEGRTWDNSGRVEDIATGSAAGPAGAYLVAYGKHQAGKSLTLHQGRFVGRPSRLAVIVSKGSTPEVRVGGDVAVVGHGYLTVPDELMAKAQD